MRAVAVVTSAGSAERFGGRKLLALIDGETLLDRTIRTLLDTARSPEASRPGREGPGGYYVELIGGMDGSIRSFRICLLFR